MDTAWRRSFAEGFTIFPIPPACHARPREARPAPLQLRAILESAGGGKTARAGWGARVLQDSAERSGRTATPHQHAGKPLWRNSGGGAERYDGAAGRRLYFSIFRWSVTRSMPRARAAPSED